MAFLVLGANSVSGYTVKNSLRFNSGSSDYLNRTPASTTNRRTFTYSAWIKRSNVSSQQSIIAVGSVSLNNVGFSTDGYFTYWEYVPNDSTNVAYFQTNRLFRDVSAWYHIVVSVDTTQATSSNRVKIYINGVQETSFSTATYPSQNQDLNFNTNVTHQIGRYPYTGTAFFNGYMSEIYMIDGQALEPTSFGETDTDTGIWKPKAYTGTYGTNGFYLKFANSASLGTDSSGNGNTFTVNNLTSVDQSTDTPTNNFATINALDPVTKTLTDGNLSLTGSNKSPRGTIGFSKGKWYWECKLVTQISSEQVVGIVNETFNPTDTTGSDAYGWGYIIQSNANNGQAYHSNATTQYATFTTNDILNVAVDMDNQAIYFGKNGTYQNSGVPTSGASRTGAIYTNLPTSGFVFPTFNCGTSGLISANFGSPPYSANSYTDGAGRGNFSYAVPSGYFSLCTANLSLYG